MASGSKTGEINLNDPLARVSPLRAALDAYSEVVAEREGRVFRNGDHQRAMEAALRAALPLLTVVTPTPIMVRMYPDFWIAGPGYEAASRVQCGHDYRLTATCPGCDADFENIDGVVRALVPGVDIATSSGDVYSVYLPSGRRIAFGKDWAHGSRGYTYTVYEANMIDDVVTTDGGGDDAMYRVAGEIARWITGERKPPRRRGSR